MSITIDSPLTTTPNLELLNQILSESEKLHRHLCPRQVLGARMGLYGMRLLGFVDHNYAPRYLNKRKELLAIVEMDGCGADGISVATNCWVGRRTLRVEDYGKMAATFIHVQTHEAIRIAPAPEVRQLAMATQPTAQSRWHAYLEGYQSIPDEQLFRVQSVWPRQSIASIISRAGARVACDACGEEIMNERDVSVYGRTLCVPCAGGKSYYLQIPSCFSSSSPSYRTGVK